jgi:hypothetical protein
MDCDGRSPAITAERDGALDMKPKTGVGPAVRMLSRDETSEVGGGMMKIVDHPPSQGDTGTTWVPEGTVKVYLAGVQIG